MVPLGNLCVLPEMSLVKTIFTRAGTWEWCMMHDEWYSLIVGEIQNVQNLKNVKVTYNPTSRVNHSQKELGLPDKLKKIMKMRF